jgi:hypothetical protein
MSLKDRKFFSCERTSFCFAFNWFVLNLAPICLIIILPGGRRGRLVEATTVLRARGGTLEVEVVVGDLEEDREGDSEEDIESLEEKISGKLL